MRVSPQAVASVNILSQRTGSLERRTNTKVTACDRRQTLQTGVLRDDVLILREEAEECRDGYLVNSGK